MKTYEQVEALVNDIAANYCGKPFNIRLGDHGDGRWWLQVGMNRPNTYRPDEVIDGWGGKAYVSPHSTDDEIVKKVFGLIMAYVEHETREGFMFKGKRIFGPHITLEALMSVADETAHRHELV